MKAANESRHRERELLLYDMYQSEAQYTIDLVVARDAYINPLRKQIPAQTSHGLLSGRIVCTDQELRLLFNNLEQILELHREYLAKLENRYCNTFGQRRLWLCHVTHNYPFFTYEDFEFGVLHSSLAMSCDSW
jgi:hypothetical protein